MSAPERFQVGDTVRCVKGYGVFPTEGKEYTVTRVDTNGDGDWHIAVDGQWGWYEDRFVLVSRPTPPALDPFAWTDLAGHLMGNPGIEFDLRIKSAPFITAWVAWSRFCYWAAQSNLAAHFLPTTPAARTRASNGRDVPVDETAVMLPTDVVMKWAAQTVVWHSHERPTIEACRRALGGGDAS